MKEMHSWEKEIGSWTPRQPSPRMARRLFGKTEAAPLLTLRRAVFWMTPMAACALTMLLAVGSLNHPAVSDEGRESLVYCAVPDPSSSNSQQMVRMRQMDENVEWNVWPQLTPPVAAVVATAAAARVPADSFPKPRSDSATNLIW